MILLNHHLCSSVIKFFSYENDPVPSLLKKKSILGCFFGGTLLTMGARYGRSCSFAPYFVLTGAGLFAAGVAALIFRRVLKSLYREESIRVVEAARVVAGAKEEVQNALRDALREKEAERAEIERIARRKDDIEAASHVERKRFRGSVDAKTRVDQELKNQREREARLEEKKQDLALLKEEAEQRNQNRETEALNTVSEILRYKSGEADKEPTKEKHSKELEKLESEKEAFKKRVGSIDEIISSDQKEVQIFDWALRDFCKSRGEIKEISDESFRKLIGLMLRFSEIERARWKRLEAENNAHKKVFSEWVVSYRKERDLLKIRMTSGNFKTQESHPVALGSRVFDERTRLQTQEANFSKRAADSEALIAGCKDFLESFKNSAERREALSLLEEVDKIAVFLKQSSISLHDERKGCVALEEFFYFFRDIKRDSFWDRLVGLTGYFREKIKKLDEELEVFELRKSFLERRLKEEKLPEDLIIRKELLRG